MPNVWDNGQPRTHTHTHSTHKSDSNQRGRAVIGLHRVHNDDEHEDEERPLAEQLFATDRITAAATT